MSEGIVVIRKGREKPINQQHPWIFSGAIFSHENAVNGELVKVVDSHGNFLARGYWNERSQIQVRILTWQDEEIDMAWWRKAIRRAIFGRGQTYWMQAPDSPAYAYRVVNAENDFCAGLIVDRYGDYLVLQALTLYIDLHKQEIAELLAKLLPVKGIYERSDADARGREGIKPSTGLFWGEELPELIEIHEGSTKVFVDVRKGHKTGFYLDQRENRHALTDVINDYKSDAPAQILNLFSYTGGFGLAAGTMGGVHVVNVDSSADALALAEKNFIHNDFHETTAEYIQADVFDYLRDKVKEGASYDVVILDPPKFAHNKQQVDRAAHGYKDINLSAFKLVKSGGYLMTFSCSGAIDRDLFQKIVFGAMADSGRQAQVLKQLSASPDHPVALSFPEGEYLKGLLLRVW